jgi:hypothetical protein
MMIDQLHMLIDWRILFEMTQESNKLLVAMALLAGTDGFAIQEVAGSEQS